MASRNVLELLSLLFAGLLAGEELVVRYGVRDAITTLDDAHHIALRQALIYRLRVLVPALFVPTLALATTTLFLGGSSLERGARGVGVAALVVWLLLTVFGTIPINEAAVAWEPGTPPSDWRAQIDRWERLNTVRSWSAFVAFVALLSGAGLRLG